MDSKSKNAVQPVSTGLSLSLDELYQMVAHVYSEQNARRSAAATFAHFVEVCGMLTVHDSAKTHGRDKFDLVEDALCRALGWYLPLLAKFNVASVERLVFRKYPRVCPYCQKYLHVEKGCKRKDESKPLEPDALRKRAKKENRPGGLDEWQQMFNSIYPRQLKDTNFSLLCLLEELGELAEAIRVFERYPKYFAGEAADVFSYIMGIANEHEARLEGGRTFSFERAMLVRYPGLCVQCGEPICNCPSLPDATVGRMAKELEVSPNERLFGDGESRQLTGREAAVRVLQQAGGYAGLTARFPFDRGAANRTLTMFLLHAADQATGASADTATQLRAAALRVARSIVPAGSLHKADVLAADVREVLGQDGVPVQLRQQSERLAEAVGEILASTVRTLLVAACPSDWRQLDIQREVRVIHDSAARSWKRRLEVQYAPAATSDDLRRYLMVDTSYQIVHIASHGTPEGAVVAGADGMSKILSIAALRRLMEQHRNVKILLLNACWTLEDVDEPIAPITIGVDRPLSDVAAIEFAKGFYDGIGSGRSVRDAIDDGVTAAEMAGKDKLQIKVLGLEDGEVVKARRP